MLLDAIEEGLLFQQIARWITGQGKLGERNHLGTRGGGPMGEGEDLLSIAAQVADGSIRLCEGNLHGEITIVPGDGGRSRLRGTRPPVGQLMPLPESTHFRPVAAVFHVAPVAATVAASVEEYPSAFVTAALAEAREIAGSKQVGRRERHGPEDSVE